MRTIQGKRRKKDLLDSSTGLIKHQASNILALRRRCMIGPETRVVYPIQHLILQMSKVKLGKHYHHEGGHHQVQYFYAKVYQQKVNTLSQGRKTCACPPPKKAQLPMLLGCISPTKCFLLQVQNSQIYPF